MRTQGCQLTGAFGVSEHLRVHLLPLHMELPGVQALDDVAHVCSELLQRGCGCMAFCSQRHLRGLCSGAAGRCGERAELSPPSLQHRAEGNHWKCMDTSSFHPLTHIHPNYPTLHTQWQMFSYKATNHMTAWPNPRLNSPSAVFARSGYTKEKLTQKISRSFCYMFFLWVKQC